MDNKSTTKRMIGAVVLVLVAALLLAWLLKGKNGNKAEPQMAANTAAEQSQTAQPQQASGDATPIEGFPTIATQQAEGVVDGSKPELLAEQGQADAEQVAATTQAEVKPVVSEQAKTEVATATPAAPQGLVGKADSEKVGFEITAAKKGEMREVIDTNGQNINTSAEQTVATAAAKATEEQAKAAKVEAATVAKQEAAKQEVAAALAAQKAAEANTQAAAEKKAAPQQVAKAPTKVANPSLVNEKRVPEASSVESVAKAKAQEKARIAAEKEAARKAALAKADTSVEATTSSAAKRDGFVIQVLATANQGKANTVRKSIAVDGYPAFVTAANINGKSVYRVRVGTYKGKRDAVAVQAQMKARYRKNSLVQNSFVTNNK